MPQLEFLTREPAHRRRGRDRLQTRDVDTARRKPQTNTSSPRATSKAVTSAVVRGWS